MKNLGLDEAFCAAVSVKAENFPFLYDRLVEAGYYKRGNNDDVFPARGSVLWNFEGVNYIAIPEPAAAELLDHADYKSAQLRNGPFVYGMTNHYNDLRAGRILIELMEGDVRTGVLLQEEAAFRLSLTGSLQEKKRYISLTQALEEAPALEAAS